MELAREQVVDTSPDFTVPGDMIEEFGENFSKNEYADYCVRIPRCSHFSQIRVQYGPTALRLHPQGSFTRTP